MRTFIALLAGAALGLLAFTASHAAEAKPESCFAPQAAATAAHEAGWAIVFVDRSDKVANLAKLFQERHPDMNLPNPDIFILALSPDNLGPHVLNAGYSRDGCMLGVLGPMLLDDELEEKITAALADRA